MYIVIKSATYKGLDRASMHAIARHTILDLIDREGGKTR